MSLKCDNIDAKTNCKVPIKLCKYAITCINDLKKETNYIFPSFL